MSSTDGGKGAGGGAVVDDLDYGSDRCQHANVKGYDFVTSGIWTFRED
jgi:hypothetical protein